jgi:hypothetical protein
VHAGEHLACGKGVGDFLVEARPGRPIAGGQNPRARTADGFFAEVE